MQVLTISRVSWVFVNKRSLLHSRGDFPKACRLLLEHVEKLALTGGQHRQVHLRPSQFSKCSQVATHMAFHEVRVGDGSLEAEDLHFLNMAGFMLDV